MQHIDVNGVWQLGRPNDEHEQEHEDISLPQEHVTGILNPKSPMIRQC